MNEVVIESPRYGVWGSKTQLTVALLISKAKYKGATIAACEAIWLKRLLKDLNESVDALGVDKLQQFSINLGLRVLDLPSLRRIAENPYLNLLSLVGSVN